MLIWSKISGMEKYHSRMKLLWSTGPNKMTAPCYAKSGSLNHGHIFTGLPASRVPRFAPLVELALAAWARQFELFTSGLTSQHAAGHRCDSCGNLNVYFVVQFIF